MINKKLIIIGDSSFAQVACEYFTHDSGYEVIAFSVERSYLKNTTLLGLPVVPFEEIEKHFSSDVYEVYVAIVYTQLNRLRTRLVNEVKSKGYRLASYVSSQSFVWKNTEIGEHCFIFEDNTVQPFVKIGNNVVLWSGNHIGHHSVVDDNCFISSHVVVSGHCVIGKNCFIGVNATLANNVHLGVDNWIPPGVVIMKDTEESALFKAPAVELSKLTARRFFKISE